MPERWHAFVKSVGAGLPVAPSRLEWQPGKATQCKRCKLPRPERAHHCHVCNVCIMRMDHHCPWIRNCVGFRNHKFFLLLVMYCMLSSMLALGTSLPELWYVTLAFVQFRGAGEWKAMQLQPTDAVVFLIFGALAFLFGGLLMPMLVTHLELAGTNTTTIEGHYDSSNMPNPFDQGSMLTNLAQICGAFGLDWLLPVQPCRPLSDGICYLRAGDGFEIDAGGDPATDVSDEQLWRLRYQVRSSTPQSDVQGDRSGSASGTWWWPRSPEAARDGVVSTHTWLRNVVAI